MVYSARKYGYSIIQMVEWMNFLLYDGVLWTANFTPPDAPFSY